jgi:long-subunit fatty acid transport protein
VALTRNGTPANDVNVDLPLPMSVRGGARYRSLQGTREVFDVEVDLEYETWSRVNQFAVETHGLHAFFLGQDIPLNDIVLPKQWRDTLAVKVGGDWSVLPDRLALRAGAFYETAAADPAYANVDFPGGAMWGGSLGASVRFGAWELAAAYQARLQRAVSVSEADARVYQQVPGSNCPAPYTDPDFCSAHYVGQPAPAVNAGRYEAASHYVLLALSYRFSPRRNDERH